MDRESFRGLIFTRDLYVNPYHEHKNSSMKIRLAVVFVIMLFLSFLLLSTFILIQSAPIKTTESTTTFTTNE